MTEKSRDESASLIAALVHAEKKTIMKAYINGHDLPRVGYGNGDFQLLIGTKEDIETYLQNNAPCIEKYYLETAARNSAVGLLDISGLEARIEPGAIIREQVEIGKNAVIMMGAIVNIGAKIGARTMIDMGAVIGGRAEIGENCHIGANAVIAGVIEPPSATPVRIGDDVLVGAGAVIIEGVRVGNGAVIGAGSVVLEDVEPGAVVVGNPGRAVKKKDEKTKEKTALIAGLREL